MVTDTQTTEELLACPFCGSNNLKDGGSYIRCAECSGAVIDRNLPPGDKREWLRKRWNQRAGHGEHGVTTREAVSSGEWLDALEAALRCVKRGREHNYAIFEDDEENKAGLRYELILSRLIAAERCRASNGRTERSQEAGVAPPEIRSGEWVEELAQSWERRANSWSMQDPHASYSAETLARTVRNCIKELRACAESSSTD